MRDCVQILEVNVEINVMEHLSDREIKEIVQDELRISIRQHFNECGRTEADNNLKRLISNASYDVVAQMVDNIFGNTLETLLTKRVTEIIEKGLTSFEIFSKPNSWDNQPNNAYVVLERAVKLQHKKMRQVVIDNIEIQTITELKEILKDNAIVDIIAEIYKEI